MLLPAAGICSYVIVGKDSLTSVRSGKIMKGDGNIFLRDNLHCWLGSLPLVVGNRCDRHGCCFCARFIVPNRLVFSGERRRYGRRPHAVVSLGCRPCVDFRGSLWDNNRLYNRHVPLRLVNDGRSPRILSGSDRLTAAARLTARVTTLSVPARISGHNSGLNSGGLFKV